MAESTEMELREWIIEAHYALNDVVVSGEEQVNVARRALYVRREAFPTPDPRSLEIYDAASDAGFKIAKALEKIEEAQLALEAAKDECAKAVATLDRLSAPTNGS